MAGGRTSPYKHQHVVEGKVVADTDRWLDQVATYYKELQLCLREQETKFDNAVLLVAGGAFTISAAFISDLEPPLSAAGALATAWLSWALCLLVGVGGHLVGAHATKRVIQLLDAEQYDARVLTSGRAAQFIRPLNVTTFALLIVGFVAFGCFTFANLDFGGRREEEIQISEEEGSKEKEESERPSQSSLDPTARAPMAAPQESGDVSSANGRQETSPTAAAPASPPGAEAHPVHEGQTGSANRAVPAAGLAPAKEIDPQRPNGR